MGAVCTRVQNVATDEEDKKNETRVNVLKGGGGGVVPSGGSVSAERQEILIPQSDPNLTPRPVKLYNTIRTKD